MNSASLGEAAIRGRGLAPEMKLGAAPADALRPCCRNHLALENEGPSGHPCELIRRACSPVTTADVEHMEQA